MSEKQDKYANNIITKLQTGKGSDADAFLNAGYVAETRQIAKSNASRLKKHPKVKSTIDNYKNKLTEYAPVDKRAKIISEIALDKSDKRTCIEANKYISQIQDEFPASKSKVIGLFDKLSDIQDKDNT